MTMLQIKVQERNKWIDVAVNCRRTTDHRCLYTVHIYDLQYLSFAAIYAIWVTAAAAAAVGVSTPSLSRTVTQGDPVNSIYSTMWLLRLPIKKRLKISRNNK
uniref:Uncharacterized protein n=1 Tax=Glossina pallidipes TaxID=7398 RepID=A0A1B0A2V8_GLOPL